MSEKSSQSTAQEASWSFRASAWGKHGHLTLTATIMLLFTLVASLASCDGASTARASTLTPTSPPAITEFAVPTAKSQPMGITPGPDGALWFTEGAEHKVGRISTGGAITEFSL